MKNKIIYIIILVLSIGISNINAQKTSFTYEGLNMGPGYANDIYYSMDEGQIANIPRAGWDIAFYTCAISAGIIINEGSGSQLYCYPTGDTSDWESVDTVGMNSWKVLYNSPENWEDGAFNRNATGHPDYGWGVYNTVTHNVTGDSIYVIKVGNELKKLWIIKKVSINNIYHIRYANLDGSNEQIIELDIKPYVDKNFVYYSLVTNELLNREPTDNWDLLFTKYIDITYDNSGIPVEYLVTGATSNINGYANKFYPVPEDYDNFSAKPFDSLKNVIGYNWKSFNMASFSWMVEDSTVFFNMNQAGDVFKLIFTLWEGSSTGYFEFSTELIQPSAINGETENQLSVSVYPNPASEFVVVNINDDVSFNGKIIINDLSGRVVYKSVINNTGGNVPLKISTNNFVKGMYTITIVSDEIMDTQKLVIR